MGKNNVVDTGPFAASDACGEHGVKRRRGGFHFRVKSNTTNQAHVHQTHDFDTNTGIHAQMLAKTLVRAGAMIPTHQACPITKDQIQYLLPKMTPLMEIVMLVAYKTASRAGEVAKMRRRDVIILRPDRIIIDWGQRTKATRSQPYRPDTFTVIEGTYNCISTEYSNTL